MAKTKKRGSVLVSQYLGVHPQEALVFKFQLKPAKETGGGKQLGNPVIGNLEESRRLLMLGVTQ